MRNDTDDLVPLILPSPSKGIQFAIGKILSWDPENFNNEVEFRGVTLTNLNVHSGTEALTYQAGDVVELNGWIPEDREGVGTWWIRGRIVTPGAGRGEEAVAFLQTELASALVDEIVEALLTSPAGETLARAIIADTVHANVVAAEQTLNESAGGDSGFTNLSTTGPQISFTTSTGKWAVILVATVGVDGDAGTYSAQLGYSASGDQTVSASSSRAAKTTLNVGAGNGFFPQVFCNVHTGSPGDITVTAKYRLVAAAGSATSAGWQNRAMIIIAY